jgi:Flp pilus assembly pilin Flp
MLEVLFLFLRNEDGFTATEIGLMAALTVIYLEWALVKY